jgi:hypothetical protein
MRAVLVAPGREDAVAHHREAAVEASEARLAAGPGGDLAPRREGDDLVSVTQLDGGRALEPDPAIAHPAVGAVADPGLTGGGKPPPGGVQINTASEPDGLRVEEGVPRQDPLPSGKIAR